MTQSTAVFSDAMESIVNIIAAFVALMVVRAVSEPADEEHPYGHGKLEYFSATFEGGLIAFAAVAIAIEAGRVLLYGREINPPDLGILVLCFATVINLALGLYLRMVGKKHQSETLAASSAHVISDVWTTVAVIVGLGLIYFFGVNSWARWLDPIIGLAVAANLAFEGYKIVRRSMGALIDEKDPKALQSFAKALNQFRQPWVIDVHHLRMIRSGHFHHVDAHIVVPEYWDVLKTHEVAHEYEQQVVTAYKFEGEIAFHVDPCGKKYCTNCAMPDCSIRLKPFTKQNEMTDASLVKGPIY